MTRSRRCLMDLNYYLNSTSIDFVAPHTEIDERCSLISPVEFPRWLHALLVLRFPRVALTHPQLLAPPLAALLGRYSGQDQETHHNSFRRAASALKLGKALGENCRLLAKAVEGDGFR